MQLRTFVAKDMREALAHARREMGGEAVIVASQRAKDGGVIVRVAADALAANANEIEAPPPDSERIEFVGTFEQLFFDGLIRRLRSEPAPVAPRPAQFNRSELLRILGRHRVPESLGHPLAEAAEKSGLSDMTLALASALGTRMQMAPLVGEYTEALLLLGPCGAGKTAVAAKIAAHAKLAGKRAVLIASDIAGAGAVARLEAFALHLDVACERSESADALASLVASTKTLSIVDTAGFDPREGKARTAFAALAQIPGIEPLGVVSATVDADEIAEITAALRSMGCSRLIVTGLDATRRLGALFVAAVSGMRLAHVTRSPFVSAGLETLAPVALARALVEGEMNRSAQ